MKLVNSRNVYSGKKFSVRVDTYESSGSEYRVEIIEHKGAVVILPITDEGKIVFVKQYRYPIRKELIELPAGTLSKGESPLRCAARELEEETGYSTSNFTLLGILYPSPGYSSEILYVYLAKDLQLRGQKPEVYERITSVMELYPEEVMSFIRDGKINDAKTLATLLLFLVKKGRVFRF